MPLPFKNKIQIKEKSEDIKYTVKFIPSSSEQLDFERIIRLRESVPEPPRPRAIL